MNIAVIGTGFVGVVTSAVLASFGNDVVGLDIDEKKVNSLKQGKVPFFEPDLEDLLIAQQASKNLTFTTDYEKAISNADIIMIAVGTPSAADGTADLKFVLAASESLAPHLKENAIVVIKSTVPPGTLAKVEEAIAPLTTAVFHTASVPEFLREGTAVKDTLNPDRVVIGTTSDFAFTKLSELHTPLNAEIIRVKPESAQMGKYTSNAYLATRITFINQIADLCAANGADISEVIQIIGKDARIGKHYWYPGLGYGGSCFPKDVKELAAYARSIGKQSNLMVTINQLNDDRIPMILSSYEAACEGWENKKVAVLGLSFKPDTNDMREAPSTKIIPILLDKGAEVVGYDPKSLNDAEYFLPKHDHLTLVPSIEEAVQDADCIMILIEWPEIVNHSYESTKEDKKQWFFDTRNQLKAEPLKAMGYLYYGIGM